MTGTIIISGKEWKATLDTEGMDLDTAWFLAHGWLLDGGDTPIGNPDPTVLTGGVEPNVLRFHGKVVLPVEDGTYDLGYTYRVLTSVGDALSKGWLKSLSIGPRLEEAP